MSCGDLIDHFNTAWVPEFHLFLINTCNQFSKSNFICKEDNSRKIHTNPSTPKKIQA